MRIEERCTVHMAWRTIPVQCKGQCRPTGLRTEFFLSHIVGPTAATLTNTATHDQHVHDGTIVHVHVIPVVHGRADNHHRLTMRIMRILSKLTRHLGNLITRHTGNLFLPGRGVRDIVIVAAGHVIAA